MSGDKAGKGDAVLVTGAAGALGQAVTRYFLQQGADVVALDLTMQRLDAAFGGSSAVRKVAVDLTNRSGCEEALQALVASGVRVLVNVAGGFRMGEPVHETSDETWDFLFGLNVRSIVNVTSVIVPAMLAAGGGRIVNVAAAAAVHGNAGMGIYAASKAGVMRLTESMAQELRGRGINVNAVMPSIIDTPVNRQAMPDADFATWVAPDDVAAVIGFLASDAACAVHGACVPVVGLV